MLHDRGAVGPMKMLALAGDVRFSVPARYASRNALPGVAIRMGWLSEGRANGN